MKIGFDAKRAYQNYTGLGNYSRDLIRNLLTFFPENEYHLYAPKITENPRFDFVNLYKNVHLHSPNSPYHKRFKGIWRTLDLEKVLLNDKIDVFHGLSNEIPKRKSNAVKYIVTIHDLIFKRFPSTYNAIDRTIYDIKFKYAAQQSDKIIAISEQTKQDIVDFYQIPSSKIEVVYQTCHQNFKHQYSKEEKEKVRTKYNLPKQYILNVGTIETRKNLNALVQALPLMKNKIPLVVVGKKTKYINFIKVQMQKLKLSESQVLFLENVSIDELPAIYQMAEVFVYPSIFEGFGIPIIEALYSKTPVVTTKGGCFPEAGGQYSKYVDPNNFQELANTVDEVLNNKALKNKMKEEGFKYVQKFNPELLSQQLMNVYKKVMES